MLSAHTIPESQVLLVTGIEGLSDDAVEMQFNCDGDAAVRNTITYHPRPSHHAALIHFKTRKGNNTDC